MDVVAQLKRGEADQDQLMGYQQYRLGFRDVARNTDERTLISTVVTCLESFTGNSTLLRSDNAENWPEMIFFAALYV